MARLFYHEPMFAILVRHGPHTTVLRRGCLLLLDLGLQMHPAPRNRPQDLGLALAVCLEGGFEEGV